MTRPTSSPATLRAAEACLCSLGVKQARLGGDLPTAQYITACLLAARRRGAALPPVIRVSGRGFAPGDVAFTTPFAKPVLQITPDLLRAPLAAGFFADPTPQGVLIHELGHFAHWRRLGMEPYLALARRRLSGPERATAHTVSPYAATDPCEFVAETFTGLSAGRTYGADVLTLYVKFGGPDPLRQE
jgi:hypothetical protein